jgi:hypothetical protein
VRRVLLASLLLFTAAVCLANDLDDRPAQLKWLVKELKIQVQPTASTGSPAICRRVLEFLTTDDRAQMRPSLVSSSYDEAKFAPYLRSCPRFDVREYQSPEGPTFWANTTFRVFEIPRKDSRGDAKGHFILFAESYSSLRPTEPSRGRRRVHPAGSFAWSDGNGGGAIYSIVNQASCSFEGQLVVHAEFNHVAGRRTPHFSEPFIFGKTLYVYDFHDYVDDQHNYAGLVVWSLENPGQPRPICVYDSEDARARLSKTPGSPEKSPEPTHER